MNRLLEGLSEGMAFASYATLAIAALVVLIRLRTIDRRVRGLCGGLARVEAKVDDLAGSEGAG